MSQLADDHTIPLWIVLAIKSSPVEEEPGQGAVYTIRIGPIISRESLFSNKWLTCDKKQ